MDGEPVTAEPARRVGRSVFTQAWEPTVFLHWPVDPDAAARLMPKGCRPDTFEGLTYVGLIPLVIRRVRTLGTPPVPYLSTFTELNVRLYSVDAAGRRGIVFLSLEAERLVPVLVAQATYGLPYKWAKMSYENCGDEHTWHSVRRWPGPHQAHAHVRVSVGAPMVQPDPLAMFLTARWALHTTLPGGRSARAATEHAVWGLHEATVDELDETVIEAGGLPAPVGEPHVMFSPGVTARIGPPERLERH
ncbi:MAG: hypothetical protein DLM59_14520 [Pseudonocardiales bacterium]|nr:MAG: hypothetical protein DLM59_14520 [Pseudonocardiales bacterium]